MVGLKPSADAEIRRVIRAGQQEALPIVLKGRAYPREATSTVVHVLAFEVMKHLPAFHMIDLARRTGLLRPGQTVVDTSSGTFALGLARVCQTMGHPCIIAADRAISSDLLSGIEARGARVSFIDAPTNATSVQELRKRLRDDLAREHDAFVPNQYDNPANPESYRAAAEIVGAAIGHIDVLITTVGSGGSSRGLAVLRDLHPLHVVAVDTFGSILFGLPEGPRELRGLGNGIMPGNLDHAIFDEVHWVMPEIALEGVVRIEEAGLGSRGLTSGAAWMVAQFIAASSPDASVLAVFPDLGWRYRSEVAAYQLQRNPSTPLSPTRVSHPGKAQPPWSWMSWDQRTLAAVRRCERGEP